MRYQRVRSGRAKTISFFNFKEFLLNRLNIIFTCVRYESSESHSVVPDSLWPNGLYNLWNSPGQNTGVGSLSLCQRIFPIHGWNPGLRHCRKILYQLSHKGSPRIPEWVAYPFSRGSSQPRNSTGVSCIAGGLFTNWAIRRDRMKYTEWQ